MLAFQLHYLQQKNPLSKSELRLDCCWFYLKIKKRTGIKCRIINQFLRFKRKEKSILDNNMTQIFFYRMWTMRHQHLKVPVMSPKLAKILHGLRLYCFWAATLCQRYLITTAERMAHFNFFSKETRESSRWEKHFAKFLLFFFIVVVKASKEAQRDVNNLIIIPISLRYN